MAYCIICGRQHDPSVGCLDGAGQVLKDLGIPRSRNRFHTGRRNAARGGRAMVPLVIAVVAALLLVFWLAGRIRG